MSFDYDYLPPVNRRTTAGRPATVAVASPPVLTVVCRITHGIRAGFGCPARTSAKAIAVCSTSSDAPDRRKALGRLSGDSDVHNETVVSVVAERAVHVWGSKSWTTQNIKTSFDLGQDTVLVYKQVALFPSDDDIDTPDLILEENRAVHVHDVNNAQIGRKTLLMICARNTGDDRL